MSRGTLVDSNVLLDILTEDPTWLAWSTDALAEAAEAGPLYINPVVYAEVSVRFSSVEALEDALPSQVRARLLRPRRSGRQVRHRLRGTGSSCPIRGERRHQVPSQRE